MKKNLQYASNTNLDKSNRSIISKSSRLTKKNPQQQNHQLNYIYFQKGKIGDKVKQRTSTSKNLQKDNNHLDKAGKIIKDLMNRHKKAKQKLQKLKQQSQRQHDRQCPFTPKKNKMQRYHIEGNVIRRSQIWIRQKKKRQLQLKESVVLQDLRQCTFTPSFSSKKASQSYLKQRSMMKSLTPQHNNRNKNKIQQTFSPFKSFKKDFTQAQYQMAKRNLISKIMIAID